MVYNDTTGRAETGVAVWFVAIPTTVCIVMLFYSVFERKKKVHVPLMMASTPLVLTAHYIGGILLSGYSVPFLIPGSEGESDFQTKEAQLTERIQCSASILLFHFGFMLFFGPPLLILHKLSFEESIDIWVVAFSKRKLHCLHLTTAITTIAICSIYLSLWLFLHPPNTLECEDSHYSTYLLIVEKLFLIFGIYLTSSWEETSYPNQRMLMRTAFILSIVTGIIMYWIRTLGRTRQEKVMISAMLSFLYVFIFIFVTQLIPLIKYWLNARPCEFCPSLCMSKHRKISAYGHEWNKSKTSFLTDQRRLTARTDVPSLPKDPDASLAAVYY